MKNQFWQNIKKIKSMESCQWRSTKDSQISVQLPLFEGD